MISRISLAVAGALLLAACSGKPPVETGRPVAATTATEVDAIADLLHEGKHKEARKRLDAALKRDPTNPSLMLLKQAVTGDARVDLGPANFPYVVQRGDTMTKLAERFLGNRLKAYQLARYNGIDRPNALEAGTVLRIPGQPPRPAPTPRASTAAPAPSQPPAPRPAPAAKTDPARAKQAHAAGLAALNKGRVNEAVTELRRAAALDPGNAAIGRDLARAERIAATVRGGQ